MGTTGSGTGTLITEDWKVIRDRVRRDLKDDKYITIDACNAAWTANTNVTCTADTTYYKEGTASAKQVLAAGFTTGVAAYKDLSSPVDLSQQSKVVFWVRPSINSITAGQLEIILCKATAGAGQTENLDIPAMATADQWYRFSVDLVDPSDCGDIVCVGLNATADVTACDVYLDGVQAEQDSYRYTDDALDTHIERGVRELSHVLPRKRETILRSVKTCHSHEDETNTVSASSASSLATAYTLAAEYKDDFNTHIAATGYHKAADSTNTISASDPDSAATLVTFIVEARDDLNAHLIESGVHYVDDEINAVTDDDAHTDDSTDDLCQKLNNIVDAYENHLDEEGTGCKLNISTLTSRLRVSAVEFPTGNNPPSYEDFEVYGDVLTLLTSSPPSDNDKPIKVYWHAFHTSASLEDYQEDLVCMGAEGYALLEYSAHTTNAVNVGDVGNFKVLGNEKLARFRGALTYYKAGEPRKPTKATIWDWGL